MITFHVVLFSKRVLMVVKGNVFVILII